MQPEHICHFASERPENAYGPRITNREAMLYVHDKKPFRAHSMYGRPIDRGSQFLALYVVYSYGPHFPLAVWDGAAMRWHHNIDRVSVTTSKHYGAAGVSCLGPGVDTAFLRKIIDCGGIVNAVARRLDEANQLKYQQMKEAA